MNTAYIYVYIYIWVSIYDIYATYIVINTYYVDESISKEHRSQLKDMEDSGLCHSSDLEEGRESEICTQGHWNKDFPIGDVAKGPPMGLWELPTQECPFQTVGTP